MQINKIVLIEPKAPGDHVYKTIYMPRLGLPLLGTLLKQEGYEVNILLGDGDTLSPAEVLDADLVGISTTTSTAPEAYRIARYVRSKGLPVVIGGIHATFMPEDALPHADYVVRGEGESSFLKLVNNWGTGFDPAAIPGLSYRENGEIRHNPLPSCWESVDEHPIPDLTLLKNHEEINNYPVMTSRGCPFDCNFCSVTPMFGHRFRYRDNELVLDELAHYKGKRVFFVDDNFTANKKRAKELMRGMLERDILPEHWGAQVRVDVASDPELLDLMQKTNGKIAYIGLESINPETMESYNKQQSVEDIKEAIRCLHDHQISVHGMFIFGGEGDTVQTIKDTVDFALDARVDTVQFMTLVPLPGTLVYDELEAQGRLLTKEWQYYDGHHVVYWPAKISPQELQEETVNAYKRFYAFRNFFHNVSITGWSTSLYRAVGWWLIRHWEKQNQGYQNLLERYIKPQNTANQITTPEGKTLALAPGDTTLVDGKQLQIHVSMKKDVIYMNLKGVLNKATLKYIRPQLEQLSTVGNYKVVVNTEGLRFASEKAVKKFSLFLNRIGGRVRSLEVFCRMEDGVHNMLEKYIPTLPRFEVVSNKK